MINFINKNNLSPFKKLYKLYDDALAKKQKNIEAIAIASYSNKNKQVDLRYVNLKFVDNNKFIFFSNYNSPKSEQFNGHKQITAVLFWSSTNIQIRMKGNIKKTSQEFSNRYYKDRDAHKNALAVSSDQSKRIDSYEIVKKKYQETIEQGNLKDRPLYWGGYQFIPYYFEFWEGHPSRLNKREVFTFKNNQLLNYFLEP
jgi:pyridoxamine 5'-phosphate oxidase